MDKLDNHSMVGWILWHINLCRLFNAKSCLYILLHFHIHVHAEIYIYILDTYRRNDNRRMQKDAGINDAGRLLLQYFTSHFIARVQKGCSRFSCERELEIEHKL